MKDIRKAGAALALAGILAVGNAGVVDAGESSRVNINHASVAELTSLPGIGPAKAAAIVEEREHAPFRSVADLTRVSGIGDTMLEQLQDRISVGEPEKVSGAGRN
jgi:competence protein ComEA